MRLAGVEKLGYYPTPPVVTDLIAKWLLPCGGSGLWRLLDPCAGEGEAAARLIQTVGGTCESWGVELSTARAEKAALVLSKVHNTAWSGVRCKEQSVSVLFLNPPYNFDLDGSEKRLEIEFLRTAIPSLVQGGILVYIIPQRILGYKAVGRMLAGYFDHLVVRRFPDGEYERFNQVVVFGVRRTYEVPTNERISEIQCLTDTNLQILQDPASPWPQAVPPAPVQATLRRMDVSDRERVALAHRLGWPADLMEAMSARTRTQVCPALPMKKGHVAMMMSSGLMGSLLLSQDDDPVLVKGRVVKKIDTTTDKDDKGHTVTVEKEHFATSVGLITPGGVEIIEDVEGLTAFMEKYGDLVANEVLKNPPLYDLKPSPRMWQAVSCLGKNRQPLPGQREPGLLDVQKHAAIGLVHAVKRHGHGMAQGEMGIGKTTIILAAIDLLGSYPALVMCPPHLVPKWMREAKEVIPGVQVRELKRIGRDGDNGDVNDVQQFIDDWQRGFLGDKAIAVMASTSAKLGSKWNGAMATRYRLPKKDDRLAFRTALEQYKAARCAWLAAKAAGEEDQRLHTATVEARKRVLDTTLAYPVCPQCGQLQVEKRDGAELPILDFHEFSKKAHACDRTITGYAQEEDGRIRRDENGNRLWTWDAGTKHAPVCRSPLFSFGGSDTIRRWPIADYIHSKAKGFFKMLVADEVHEYKGKASDRGLAFHRLVKSCKYQIGATGTFYGGMSTSIFWLMHRLAMGQVQRDFQHNAERRWAALYGVLETRTYGKKSSGANDDDTDDFGTFNATKRKKVYVREKPGVSPAILGRIIGSTLFLSLKDLGVALPNYSEEVALIHMDDAQGQQYHSLEFSLRAKARKDQRYLSTWLQWSLSRPNSAFRDEEVIKAIRDDDGNIIEEESLMELPAVVQGNDLLPKERWLVDYCKAEVAARRTVLVYCRQTGERDIQPRLEEALKGAGLRVRVLNSTVDPRKREQWIERHAHTTDVLIVNPRLVQTGLDLVQYCTVVFYEPDYSLYVLWQACRRVWRLGQDKPVKVVYTAYAGTIEEQAMALMGRLYGESRKVKQVIRLKCA